MARFFKSIILFIGLFLVSCQEGREAGDLLGQWRMVGSDTKYISFSGSITWIRCLPDDEVFGNFQHIGDSLFIQCYSIEGNVADTILVEDTYAFKPFNNIRVKIESLTSDKLIISKNSQTWIRENPLQVCRICCFFAS